MKKLIILLLVSLTACVQSTESAPNVSTIPEKLPEIFVSTDITTIHPDMLKQDVEKTKTLLSEIQTLVEQRQADLLSQPGWLYLRTRIAGAKASHLLSWGLDLEEYEQEDWLYLDDTGRIITAVRRFFGEEQQPLQVSLLKEGTWRNLTLNAVSPENTTVPFDPNYGYYELAARLVQQGRPLHTDIIYFDCWYQGERFTVSDGQNYYEAVFNPHRRSLRWLKTYRISEGAIVEVDSMEMMIEKRIPEPPADILALLEEVASP